MNILFIHQAFPAQFGRLALELTRRWGWNCRFLIDHLSSCPSPTPEMLESLQFSILTGAARRSTAAPAPWPRVYGRWLELCREVREGFAYMGGPPPDLVVAHGGNGAPTLFLPEVCSAPIVNYCEYYFPNRLADLTYRLDLPDAEVAPFYPRCINAPTLMGLSVCQSGYSATRFQRDSFPSRHRDRIHVLHDGVDTELYRPGRARARRIGQHHFPADTRVVTYVARGLESMRGFDIFARVAQRLSRERDDVVFVVAGDDRTYYGWDQQQVGPGPFKDWAMRETGADPSRFVFLGHVSPEQLADLLSISSLHIYPSVPFVLSWSFVNAMAAGCVVLGTDSAPVREFIEPGTHGLVAPLFDIDAWTDHALLVLADPGAFASLGVQARERILEKYSLEVRIPALHDYFERNATAGNPAQSNAEERASRHTPESL